MTGSAETMVGTIPTPVMNCNIYKPVSYQPDSSAVERIVPSEVSSLHLLYIDIIPMFQTAFRAGL